MATLPQQQQGARPSTRRVQLFLDEDAFLRLKLESVKTRVAIGRVASEAIRKHVPTAEAAA